MQRSIHSLHLGQSDGFPALAMFANPKQASAMPASPMPNFFSAARRVTDWARLFVSSSNLLFIFFVRFWAVFVACLFRSGDQAIQSPSGGGGARGSEHDDFGHLTKAT